jgi:hypothetical protein
MLGTTAPDPQQRYPTPADLARAWDFFVDGATAQTGRLVPAPSPDQQTTVSVRALRRSPATSAEVAPSPVRTVPRMPAPRISPPPMAQPDGMATTPVGRPPGRWSGARRRLQRALIRRSIQIALILAALFALLAGVDYGLDRVRALDPAGWIAQQLPDLRLPGFSLPDWRELVGLSSGGRLVVNQSINLRPAPGINNTPLRELPAGTVLQKIGGPVPDPQELSLTWIEVVVVGEDAQGWVAEHPDRLRPEE